MKVLVAGSTGLVGSAVASKFEERGCQVINHNSKITNLLDRKATFEYIAKIKPDLIIDAAAKVGGIGSNSKHPYEYISENLQIQTNLMDACLKYKVDKFVFLGSSCIYPKNSPQPIREEYLLTGKLENTNSAYAIAKIAGIEAIKSAREEYGLQWISLMPTNVYGPNDNFNLEHAHVLPALIRRFYEAKKANYDSVTLWGDGQAQREFIYSSDLAEAIYFASVKYNESEPLNIGTGSDLRIIELANLISKCVGFEGNILWDTSKPNGTPKKLLDISRLKQLGWSPTINLETGISNTYSWFKKALKDGRARL